MKLSEFKDRVTYRSAREEETGYRFQTATFPARWATARIHPMATTEEEHLIRKEQARSLFMDTYGDVLDMIGEEREKCRARGEDTLGLLRLARRIREAAR